MSDLTTSFALAPAVDVFAAQLSATVREHGAQASSALRNVTGVILTIGVILTAGALTVSVALWGSDSKPNRSGPTATGWLRLMSTVLHRTRHLHRSGDTTSTTPRHPVNWDRLAADEAEREWLTLNQWVDWLCTTYRLPTSVVPPYWHRHPPLVWELAALHHYWTDVYHSPHRGSAALDWHREFADCRARLHHWVAAAESTTEQDRPARMTWPDAQPRAAPSRERAGATLPGQRGDPRHNTDFILFVADDVNRRRVAESRAADGRESGR
ncbi:hypothetical protein [Phytoactinopolyspora limicola]|uniref:hypothetical protein n=1 Tax=Phytoactinopolyspora limicola TaxID=2715536 RepID=UPI001407DD03|nr:hypothetical protein [Phytoactinopolyspora limicola]